MLCLLLLLLLRSSNAAQEVPAAPTERPEPAAPEPSAKAAPKEKEIDSRFLDVSEGWPKPREIPAPELAEPVVLPTIQEQNREKVLAYVSEIEAKVLEEYETTTNATLKSTGAGFLRELWQRGLLSPKIKKELIDRHFRAELYQIPAPHPSFAAFADLSFPFPPIQTDFDPVLHVNGKPAGTGGKSTRAMNVDRAPLASQSGGKLKNGDVLRYEIKISQRDANGEVWEHVIKSNPIRLDKLGE